MSSTQTTCRRHLINTGAHTVNISTTKHCTATAYSSARSSLHFRQRVNLGVMLAAYRPAHLLQPMNTSKLKPYLIFAPVCSLCGGIVAYTLMPLYIAVDVVRFVGLGPHSTNHLSFADVVDLGWILMIFGLFLFGPLLYAMRKEIPRNSLIFFVFAGQWPLPTVLIMYLTDTGGVWYRGLLNGLASLSFLIAHWALSSGVLRLLQKRGILN